MVDVLLKWSALSMRSKYQLDDLITVRVTKDVYLSTPTKAAKT
jgi:hypothetical protein